MIHIFKKIFIISAILTVFLVILVDAYAGDDAGTVIKKLEKKYDSIRDASITFTQSIEFGVTKAKQTFDGKLMMKKGNRYRIELEQETIVTDGKSVWLFNKLNNQTLIDKYKEDPASFTPDKVLVNVPMNYNAVLLGKEKIDDKDMSILKFTPKNEKIKIKWMKVWIDKEQWLMKKIQLLDAGNNLITYLVKELKINTGIPDSQFQFVAPAGVDVIDLR
ncbi:MAG: outer membrane lipoprotein chaperone LolA [Bacteroidota bacterium]|nr:outer membrane lipoprotein chaperone LolA [Bacteroidota bacterium]